MKKELGEILGFSENLVGGRFVIREGERNFQVEITGLIEEEGNPAWYETRPVGSIPGKKLKYPASAIRSYSVEVIYDEKDVWEIPGKRHKKLSLFAKLIKSSSWNIQVF